MKVLLVALMAAFFVSTAQAKECVTPQGVADILGKQNPGVRGGKVADEDLPAVAQGFNSMPPITNLEPAAAWIFASPHRVTVFVGLFNDRGCLTHNTMVPPSVLVTWGQMFGDGTPIVPNAATVEPEKPGAKKTEYAI